MADQSQIVKPTRRDLQRLYKEDRKLSERLGFEEFGKHVKSLLRTDIDGHVVTDTYGQSHFFKLNKYDQALSMAAKAARSFEPSFDLKLYSQIAQSPDPLVRDTLLLVFKYGAQAVKQAVDVIEARRRSTFQEPATPPGRPVKWDQTEAFNAWLLLEAAIAKERMKSSALSEKEILGKIFRRGRPHRPRLKSNERYLAISSVSVAQRLLAKGRKEIPERIRSAHLRAVTSRVR